jgi:hypothetical protein
LEKLEEDANATLSALFSANWTQSGVTARLRITDDLIRILVATEQGYASVAERSDGLRWFLALLSYVTQASEGIEPVLLVDEAETHLHYDAQADLVRLFGSQGQAAKVIYTTHSAGCLPEDVGGGIRVVEASEADEVSTIRNSYWSEGPGFSPLLLAMGASALALSSSRRAVLAEGPTEVLLLPTLLREALGLEFLGFQVAPGLAIVGDTEVGNLTLEAARIAYVVDADEGGRAIMRKLTTNGVNPDHVIALPGPTGTTIEDYIDLDVLARAVREELRRSHGPTEGFELSEERGSAWGQVLSICDEAGLEPPNKTAVAQRVLDVGSELQRSIVAASYRARARDLFKEITRIVG